MPRRRSWNGTGRISVAVLQCLAVTRDDQPSSWIRQAGLLTSIPIVLLVGPAVGYYLGNALDRRWTAAPWGMVGGLILGMLASVRIIIQLIRRSSELNGHD